MSLSAISHQTQGAELRALALKMVPPGFGCSVYSLRHPTPPLLPREAACMARAVPQRRHEFALGRRALRDALAQAGHRLAEDFPITIRSDRRPELPHAMRASLSHAGDFCIAVAAPPGGASVGVDIEARLRPYPEGLAEVVRPYRMSAEDPLLAFCVKEALFKAQFPLTGRMLEFSDIPVMIDRGRARACLGGRLIGARWSLHGDHYLAISLWSG